MAFQYTSGTAQYTLLVDGGAGAPSFYSSLATPTFTATQGSFCSTSGGSCYVNTSGPGGGTTWTLLASGTGAVTAVSATSPIASTGGASPVISLATPVPIALGGNGTATPAIGAGTNIQTSGTWPQTVGTIPSPSFTSLALGAPLPVASGGTGTIAPGIVAGSNITTTGSWPNQTINASGTLGVGSVTGTGNIASSGGTTPVISISATPTFTSLTTTGNINVSGNALVTAGVVAAAVNAVRFESLGGNGVLGVYNVMDAGAVGDGTTDDTTAIQNSINACNGGGTCYFPPNHTYLCGVLTIPTGVTIWGYGATLKASTAAGTAILWVNLANPTANVSVLGLTFDATNLTSSSGGVVFYGAPATVVDRLLIRDCRVLNLSMANPNFHAFSWSGTDPSKYNWVINNYIKTSGGDAISPGGTTAVLGNYVAQGGDGGVAMNNGATGLISGNTFRKCSLGVGCGPAPLTALHVVDNYIDSCNYGVNMGYFSFSTATGPTDVVISGNTFTQCKTAGVEYDGDPSNIADIFFAITGNTFNNMGSSLYDGANGAGYGVVLNIAPGVTVTGNTFNTCLGSGIVASLSGTTLDTVISGNTMVNVAQSGSPYYGIAVVGSDTIISNNIIDGSGWGGILFDGGPRHKLVGNSVRNCAQSGIVMGSTSVTQAELIGNSVTSCSPGLTLANAGSITMQSNAFASNSSNIAGFINANARGVNKTKYGLSGSIAAGSNATISLGSDGFSSSSSFYALANAAGVVNGVAAIETTAANSFVITNIGTVASQFIWFAFGY
jgi:hypothetical protein